MGDQAERTSEQGEADEGGHCSRENRKSGGTNERTGWRGGLAKHSMECGERIIGKDQ